MPRSASTAIDFREATRVLLAHALAGSNAIAKHDELPAVVTHWLQCPGSTPIFGSNELRNGWQGLLWAYNLSGQLATPLLNYGHIEPSEMPDISYKGVPFPPPSNPRYRFIDLFAGIGGFRLGFQNLGTQCVFSSEWDEACKETYYANYGEIPFGDIRKVDADAVPDHDILLAGFPCQAFSIMGKMEGMADTRGTLFYEIERILRAKRPQAFVLENVKMLVGHQKGKTFATIVDHLEQLGYSVHAKVLNALNFGIPQKRERVLIVGFMGNYAFKFPSNYDGQTKTLSDILEAEVDKKYYASEKIRKSRKSKHTAQVTPSVWHENKAGNVSSYPFSCALRHGASYNYLLVNGERRFTPREMVRMMGFPDEFKIVVSDQKIRNQTGNSVACNVVDAVARRMLRCLDGDVSIREKVPHSVQAQLFEKIGTSC